MNDPTAPPPPLGATVDGDGVTFAVFSVHAERIEVCVYDAAAPGRETARVGLDARTGDVFHGRAPAARAGALYGLRVHGRHRPAEGHLFDPTAVLVDPRARAIFGGRGVVVGPDAFDWGGDARPAVPWSDTVVYELHMRGFTMQHPAVPPALRGTYGGLAHPAAIDHLQSLGVTTVELLPVAASIDDAGLRARGRTNYWGYSTLGYFAPDRRFASAAAAPGGEIDEMKAMVRALHAAGIEVILDVVYNHTAEGDATSPMLAFRGIDNHTYYRLDLGSTKLYDDFTGCGNTLDVRPPAGAQFVLDSLRFWADEMHVDGFRFDLATTLGRSGRNDDPRAFDPDAPFLRALLADPVLSKLKLVAEPWDVGPGGYQLGGFPAPFREWNDRHRDSVRRFWRGDPREVGELATRLTGSSDRFSAPGRGPTSSINFVTCHDGFTLADLVSYARRHNLDNGENGADGHASEVSWNDGVEGATDEPAINELRARQRRSLLATLVLSRGVPMLCAGDEIGRTQRGNNNAYCQDNEISWLDWNIDDDRRATLDYVRGLLTLRRDEPALRADAFFTGRPAPGSAARDIVWLRPDGAEMTGDDWHQPRAALGFVIAGGVRQDLLVLLNATAAALTWTPPASAAGHGWRFVLDTARAAGPFEDRPAPHGGLTIEPGSLCVLRGRAAPVGR